MDSPGTKCDRKDWPIPASTRGASSAVPEVKPVDMGVSETQVTSWGSACDLMGFVTWTPFTIRRHLALGNKVDILVGPACCFMAEQHRMKEKRKKTHKLIAVVRGRRRAQRPGVLQGSPSRALGAVVGDAAAPRGLC